MPHPPIDHIGLYPHGGTGEILANLIYPGGGGSFPIVKHVTCRTIDEAVTAVRKQFPEYAHLDIRSHIGVYQNDLVSPGTPQKED